MLNDYHTLKASGSSLVQDQNTLSVQQLVLGTGKQEIQAIKPFSAVL